MPFSKKDHIYILLTRSGSMLSKTIHFATGDAYTHVSIAFDQELGSLCSFARKHWATPLPAGLVHESLSEDYLGRHMDTLCRLCALPVSEESYMKARRLTAGMFSHEEDYSYSIRGLLMCKMGVDEKRPGKYFCSQFVAEILEKSGALSLPKAPGLMRPQDFACMPELRPIYEGSTFGLVCAGPDREQGLGLADYRPYKYGLGRLIDRFA